MGTFRKANGKLRREKELATLPHNAVAHDDTSLKIPQTLAPSMVYTIVGYVKKLFKNHHQSTKT